MPKYRYLFIIKSTPADLDGMYQTILFRLDTEPPRTNPDIARGTSLAIPCSSRKLIYRIIIMEGVYSTPDRTWWAGPVPPESPNPHRLAGAYKPAALPGVDRSRISTPFPLIIGRVARDGGRIWAPQVRRSACVHHESKELKGNRQMRFCAVPSTPTTHCEAARSRVPLQGCRPGILLRVIKRSGVSREKGNNPWGRPSPGAREIMIIALAGQHPILFRWRMMGIAMC